MSPLLGVGGTVMRAGDDGYKHEACIVDASDEASLTKGLRREHRVLDRK
uniref:Uncharacterized protein n=1 Tax=Setaria digitata TaxID=48799 RepID=A0A915PQS1_9BILA